MQKKTDLVYNVGFNIITYVVLLEI